jgi:hypothetical protein
MTRMTGWLPAPTRCSGWPATGTTRITQATARNGPLTNYQYDAMNRRTRVTYADASTIDCTCDLGDRPRRSSTRSAARLRGHTTDCRQEQQQCSEDCWDEIGGELKLFGSQLTSKPYDTVFRWDRISADYGELTVKLIPNQTCDLHELLVND